MLDNLSLKFTSLIRSIVGKRKLSDTELDDIVRKIRKILLDSDVSLSTTKFIINNIKNKLMSLELTKKSSHGQLVLRSLHEEFSDIMGNKLAKLKIENIDKFNVILFIGLQGVGKTTSLIKFANWLFKKHKKKILLVSCDIYRPGAITQLQILAEKVSINVFNSNLDKVDDILKSALNYAKINNYDFLIVDSAGRLHINDLMMVELDNIIKILNPMYNFLVVDGMAGQDCISSSDIFIKRFNISGFIVSKMDSDTKGGIILSLVHVFKKPIYFIGTGETINDFELFYPNRLSSRILGIGDIAGLVEQIEYNLDKNSFKKMDDKFDLILFKEQLQNLLKIGGMTKLIDKLPLYGINNISNNKLDDKFFKIMINIIDSMTIKERRFPAIINFSRKRRIATGSGRSIQEINKLLKYYDKFSKFIHKDINKKKMC